MAKWRTLDLRGLDGDLVWDGVRGTLSCVAEDGAAVTASPSNCAVLLLRERARFSAGALQALARRDVTVVLCDWKGAPAVTLVPHVGTNGRACARHRAQAAVTGRRLAKAWQAVVRAKVSHQALALDAVGRRAKASQLRALAKEVYSGDPGNVEGRAARACWPALLGDGFRRAPGAAADPLNPMLELF